MSQGTLVQTEESTFQPRKLAGKMCKSGLFCDKSVLIMIIPLPVPNWASAEAQLIPNFSLSIQSFHSRGIKRKVGGGTIWAKF